MHTAREPVWVIHKALLDLGVQRRHALVVEWYPTTDENIEDNAKAPNIHLRAGVSTGLEKLGSCEVEAAAKRFEVPSRREQITESKVDDFDIAGLAD